MTAQPNNSKRRCKDGVLAEYLRYCSGQESPTDFHMWTCLGLLGMAIGRNAWCNRGAWNLYPNLYIVLIAESALARKSTALSMGIRPFQIALPDIEGLGQKITPEQLIGVLSTRCKGGEDQKAEAYIHASELSVLLGKTTLDDSLIKLLTDLWDCPDIHTYQTRAKGKEVMRDVCINMLAASTPDWLRNSVPQESLEGGFFSRLILVQRPSTGERNPFPEDIMNSGSISAKENVIHDLRVINECVKGPYEWDIEGKRAYANWYCEYNNPDSAQSFMRGYYGRKGDFVIKLAMLSAANFSNERIITKEDVLFAVKILNENEIFTRELVKFMGTTINGKMYVNVLNKIRNSVVDYVDANKKKHTVIGISHSDLMRNVGHQLSAKELKDVIEGLEQAGEIEPFFGGAKGNKKLYRKLTKGKITEQIEDALGDDNGDL